MVTSLKLRQLASTKSTYNGTRHLILGIEIRSKLAGAEEASVKFATAAQAEPEHRESCYVLHIIRKVEILGGIGFRFMFDWFLFVFWFNMLRTSNININTTIM
ncbi:hypothetical protein V8E54_006005 [Elaphomyces granulatus]